MKNFAAHQIALKIVDRLAEYCERIEIAGSIRRGRPEVGDIDLVVLANPGQEEALRARIKAKCRVVSEGPQAMVVEMPLAADVQHTTRHLQIDTWFAKRIDPELFAGASAPSTNFGTLWVCRTGSAQHNIRLCQQAQKLGLHWNPHHGVMRGADCIAAHTEEDVFAALQLPWVAPAFREGNVDWLSLQSALTETGPAPRASADVVAERFSQLRQAVK